MRPVDAEFPVSQEFGADATLNVVGDPNGTEVQQLVAEYGNYQPFGHAGQDIGCPIGTPVHAIADGTVLWADWGTNLPGDESWGPSGYFRRWALYKTFPGIVMVVQHAGWISVYAHLSDAPLNPGDVVTEGQQIARSGNTRAPGVSLGAHLHVEALVDLTYSSTNGLIYGRTDPTPFFGGTAAMGSITASPEDDLANVSDDQLNFMFAALSSLVQNVATKKDIKPIADSVVPPPGRITPAMAAAWSDYNRDLILTKVGTGSAAAGPASVDIEALVARLKAEIPAAIRADIAAKLTQP